MVAMRRFDGDKSMTVTMVMALRHYKETLALSAPIAGIQLAQVVLTAPTC